MISTPGLSQIFGCTPVDPLGWGQAFLATAIAASLSDQDMADLGAFYEANGGPAANAGAPAPTPPAQVAAATP